MSKTQRSITAFLALLLFPLFPTPANSADRPMMEASAVSFEFYPGSMVSDPRPGTFEEQVEAEISTASFLLRFPVLLSPGRTVVMNTLSYSYLRFDYKDWINEGSSYQPSEFHSLRYEANLRQRVGNKWWLGIAIRPGLASDFQNIDGKHFTLNGGLSMTRAVSARVAWGLGVAYLNEFGEPKVLPVVILRWASASERYAVNLALPQRAEAWWVLSPVTTLGLTARVEGEHYRIGEEGLQNEDSTLKYSTVNVGPEARFTLGRGTSLLKVGAGMALSRPFELRDDDGNALLTLDLEPGVYIRAGLSFMR